MLPKYLNRCSPIHKWVSSAEVAENLAQFTLFNHDGFADWFQVPKIYEKRLFRRSQLILQLKSYTSDASVE